MAPHDTNTPKEAKRHAVPLIGMAVCVVVALIGLVWILGFVFEDSPQTPVTEPASEQPAVD